MDHLQKTKKEYKKETGDSRYIYQNELDKACFQHDMAYGDFKGLNRRTASDKIFLKKAFNIAKNLKYNGYQCGLASTIYKFLAGTVKIENISNKELVEELHKPIFKIFKKTKVHPTSIDNICGANLADMQLIKKFNKGICLLLCVINILSKYAWVIPLKDKKGITILIANQIKYG